MFANKFGQYCNVNCGLINLHKRTEEEIYKNEQEKATPIPLESVIIRGYLISHVAKVEVIQVYINKEEQPIETIYYFPIDSNGAVTNFHAELEGRTIEGVVKPIEEAEAQYEKAIEQSQTAFLLESNKPDIFKVRIGFLKPGAQVKITIEYVTEVKNENGSNAIRFFIPTTVAPRYIPPGEMSEETIDLKNITFSEKSPAPLSITVDVAVQGNVKSIHSPTHKIQIEDIECENKNWTRAVIQLFGKVCDMDRDFILLVTPEDVHTPKLYLEKIEKSTVFMAHLIPSFNLYEEKVELIFVLDRSGSMQGASIDLSKQALNLFLHSLPVDCYFNIVGFGSSYQFLFPSSVKYDDDTLKKAVHHCNCLDADLGGTEIFEPLSKILSQKLIPGYLRQIFILTDGEVGDTDQVIKLCKENSDKSRIFSLGIGASASHYLVEGIAHSGGGTAVFVSYEETIEGKILHQLKNATQASLKNVVIKWSGIEGMEFSEINKEKTLLGYGKPIISTTPQTENSRKTWKQAPENIPPIFDGSQLIVFGLFNDNGVLPNKVTITADSPEGQLSIEIEVSEENDVGSRNILHKLAAVKMVRELDTQIKYTGQEEMYIENLKKELISIACEHGLVSNYTAYIAVDTTSEVAAEATENWIIQSRYVPSQYAQGWHGQQSMGFGIPMNMCLKLSTKRAKNVRSRSLNVCPSPRLFGCAGGNRTAFEARKRSAVKLCSSHEIEPISMEECDFEEYRPAVAASFSTKPRESIKSAPQDYLHAIVMTQSFNGSFPLNKAFAEAIGQNLNILKSEAIKSGWDEQIWATCLAVIFFEEKLNDFKDSWEMVAMKAKTHLEIKCGENLNDIFSAALVFFRKECK